MTSDEESRGNTFNVTSHGQQGGWTVGEVNLGRPARTFRNMNTSNIEAVAQQFPGTETLVSVPMDDPEARAFADEMIRLLEGAGWSIPRLGVGSFIPPVEGVVICVPGNDGSAVAWSRPLGEAIAACGIRVRGLLGQQEPEIIVGANPR